MGQAWKTGSRREVAALRYRSRSTAPVDLAVMLSYGSTMVVAYRTVLSGAIARTVAEYPTLSRSMANA
jgi:hypothetical protein